VNVIKTKDLGDGHLLEAGNATWDEMQISVRNRYPTRNGGFNPHSSSEIPLEDVAEIAVFSCDQDLLEQKQLVRILYAVSLALRRKSQS